MMSARQTAVKPEADGAAAWSRDPGIRQLHLYECLDAGPANDALLCECGVDKRACMPMLLVACSCTRVLSNRRCPEGGQGRTHLGRLQGVGGRWHEVRRRQGRVPVRICQRSLCEGVQGLALAVWRVCLVASQGPVQLSGCAPCEVSGACGIHAQASQLFAGGCVGRPPWWPLGVSS